VGILARLFTSNPEQIKAREDATRAERLIEQKQWDQLESIGKAAVKPLIKALHGLKNRALSGKPLSDDLELGMSVVRTLGRIGEAEAIEHLNIQSACAYKNLEGVDWDRYSALTPVVAEAFTALGKTHLEEIIRHIKKKESGVYLLDGIPIAWALCEINDKKNIEPVVNWLLSVGQGPLNLGLKLLLYRNRLLCPSDIIREFIPDTTIARLLGDYSNIIMDALAWQLASSSEKRGEIKFRMDRCAAAVNRLCDIKTPISSNILMALSRIQRLTLQFTPGSVQSREYVDFGQFGRRAMKELESRGEPRYDPEAYLDPNAWAL
jgi:hypothetical protein